MSFIGFLGTAFALVMILEGLLYACFTGFARDMMHLALTLPEKKLRGYGLLIAGLGLFSLMLIQFFE
jgi:uncharacterized protein